MIKTVGLIGLGKMGLRMALHLSERGYTPLAADINIEAVKTAEKQGILSTTSIQDLTRKVPKPKVVILSVTAGKPVDSVIKLISPHLSKGDVIIDSGNSFYKDSQMRARSLKKKGITLLDVGVSGGIGGARKGACLMIGGDEKTFKKLEPLFKDLSRDGSYAYFGKSGSGHLVKGFHNLIEYGYLQALSEGVSCLQKVSEKEKINLDLKNVCKTWNNGSIIESKLVKCLEKALEQNPDLKGISGSVFGQSQKEMEKLVLLAKQNGIHVPSCKAALDARKKSQKKPTLSGSITNAVRNVFGGHKEWAKQ